jgi:hypothetical protein
MKVMPWVSVLALLVTTTAGAASVNPLGGGLSGGVGSAFNPATQQLFFAEQYSGEVSRFDVGNNTITTVHTGLVGPSGLAMFGGYVYITTRDGRLFKGAPNMNTRSEVTNGLGMPQQLVIDTNNATAYVIDGANGILWKVNLWGGQKTAIDTPLTGAIGLAMSADFQTAYITDAVRLMKLDLGTGALTEVINGLDHAFYLEWADDARTALYVTERTSPGRVRRVDLSTSPASIALVANVPNLSASVSRSLNPNMLFEVSDGTLNQIWLANGVAQGPVITRIGHIPSTQIDAVTGQATTDPGYFFYVKNASFGGSPHVMLNFPGLRNAGAAYYRVFVDGSATPEKASWGNYKWNVSSFVFTQVLPDANGYFPVPAANELWAIPDLGFILDTSKLSNAKHTVTVKTYGSAYQLLGTQGQVSLLIDNAGPTMRIEQIAHDGAPVDECALITSGSSTLDFTFTASDAQGHLYNYALVDRWGHGKSAVITADQYLGVHDAATTWSGVSSATVSYTLSCAQCAHSFSLSGYSNTTNGFGLIQSSSDLEHVAVYLPSPTCSP